MPFYCLFCGYDLRGQAGTQRPCPECGRVTTPELLKSFVEMRQKPLRAFESPLLPGILFVPLALFGWPFLLNLSSPPPGWIKLALICFFLCWLLSVVLFCRMHRVCHDWLCVIVEVHVVCATPLTVPATCVFGVASVSGAPVVGLLLTLVFLLFNVLAYWAYRDLRRRLAILKIVRIARTTRNE